VHAFYRRFHFVAVDNVRADVGNESGLYRARLYRRDWQTCRDKLTSACVVLGTKSIPVPPIHNPAATNA